MSEQSNKYSISENVFDDIAKIENYIIKDKYKNNTDAKFRLVAAYFRIFFDVETAKKIIEECEYNADELLKNYESYVNSLSDKVNSLSDKKVSQDDFLPLLANYRDCCCPKDKWQQNLANFTAGINKEPLAFFYELVQNADDLKYEEADEPCFEAELIDGNDIIKIHYNEVGMTEQDIIAITSVGESTKLNKSGNEDEISIGEKGIGFKTVFARCDKVDVVSGKYSFSLIDGGYHLAPFKTEENVEPGTTMWLHLKKANETDNNNTGTLFNAGELYIKLSESYGISNKSTSFCKCPVLFTKHLRSIKVTHDNDSFAISVNKTNDANTNSRSINIKYDVKNKSVENTFVINCFGVYKDVEITKEAFKSRYSELDYKKQSLRIEIVAALDDNITEGNLYSYLPADQKIKAPFNVQLPIKLNINRTRMYFCGDNETSGEIIGSVDENNPTTITWNELMVKEFIELIPKFYEALKTKTDIYKYIPRFEVNDKQLFKKSNGGDNYMNIYCRNREKNLSDVFEDIPYFKVLGTDEYCSKKEAVMFESLIRSLAENGEQTWFNNLCENGIIKDKKLIAYDDDVLEYAKRIVFTTFDYKNIDKDKSELTKLFNDFISSTGCQENLLKLMSENEKPDYKLIDHVNKPDLQIIPAELFDCEKAYLAGNGIWFFSENQNLKTHKECFFHITTSENAKKFLKK